MSEDEMIFAPDSEAMGAERRDAPTAIVLGLQRHQINTRVVHEGETNAEIIESMLAHLNPVGSQDSESLPLGTLDPPSACWADPILESGAVKALNDSDWMPGPWFDPDPKSLAGIWAAYCTARKGSVAGPREHQALCAIEADLLYARIVASLKVRPGVMVQVESDLAIWWSVRNNRVEQRAVCDGREVRA